MRVAREPVEEGGLGRCREQPLRLVLPVHLDERGAEVGERRRRGDLAADPRGALAVGRHGAREHDLAVLGPLPRVGGRVEPRLHARRLRTSTDERGARSGAEREREAHGHHRLARAGLAGEHGQARVDLQVEIVDDP